MAGLTVWLAVKPATRDDCGLERILKEILELQVDAGDGSPHTAAAL
jgi:hypothetical protein